MARASAVQYDSNTNEWWTSELIHVPLREFIGISMFDMDACCSKDNIPAYVMCTKSGIYQYNPFPLADMPLSTKHDGLTYPWKGHVWLNPPYGDNLKKFIRKVWFESSLDTCEVWSILPARIENKFYHEYIFNNPYTFTVLLSGKQGFINPEKPDDKIKPTLPCQITCFSYRRDYWADKWLKEQPLKGKLFLGG